MNWTKEVPKVDGWYWVYNGEYVEPMERTDGFWDMTGVAHSFTDAAFPECYFSGPIELPQPPTPQQPPQ